MMGFNILKIVHLSSLLVLSGLVLTSFKDVKISKWKWFFFITNFLFLGLSGFFLLANLGFISSHWPFWITLKIIGFVSMVTIGLLGIRKLMPEKIIYYLWIIFSLLMVVISVQKFY